MSVNYDERTMASTKTYMGFWFYLMTDCILFATLFATYAVLRGATNGGPAGFEIFELDLVFVETILLLTSSFTCGLAILAARAGRVKYVLYSLFLTFVLGAGFLALEISEFAKLIGEGYGWTHSAFLSAFFTLVGTHGLHITVGLLWLIVLAVFIAKKGLTPTTTKRLTLFSLFWHFLDVIWIFLFTIVYLFGVIPV